MFHSSSPYRPIMWTVHPRSRTDFLSSLFLVLLHGDDFPLMLNGKRGSDNFHCYVVGVTPSRTDPGSTALSTSLFFLGTLFFLSWIHVEDTNHSTILTTVTTEVGKLFDWSKNSGCVTPLMKSTKTKIFFMYYASWQLLILA